MLHLQDELRKNIQRLLAEHQLSQTEQTFLLSLLISLMQNIEKNIPIDNLTSLTQSIVSDWLSNDQLQLLLKQQAAELDALKKLSLHFSSSLDIKTVLNAVVSDAMELHQNIRTVHIFLYNSPEDKLLFGAALDENGAKEESWAEPRQDGLTYTAARTGEIIIVKDMQNL